MLSVISRVTASSASVTEKTTFAIGLNTASERNGSTGLNACENHLFNCVSRAAWLRAPVRPRIGGRAVHL